tara:strand:- start:35303 stop:36436 length:1134 start_codon:yes stop_codon:yes gene_type:complete
VDNILVPYALASLGSEPIALSSKSGYRFRKDAAKVGNWIARNPIDGSDLKLEITRERIAEWVAKNKLMRNNGVSVDLTKDHKRGADSKIGKVDTLDMDGDLLMFESTAADDDAAKLCQRCNEVSIEIHPDYKDSKGNSYGEAITAITVCRNPVITGQQPFVPIAASRDTASPHLIIFSLNQPDVTKTPSQESDMLTKEQIAEAKKKLGLADDTADAKVAETIMLSLDAPAKISTLQSDLDKSKQTVADLQTKLAAAPAAPVQLSREVLALSKDALNTKLGSLVDKCCITPAVKDKLEAELSTPIMLSIGDGQDRPSYAKIVDILAENKAGELAKLLGEKTGVQTTNLSRDIPDGDAEQEEKELKELAERTRKAAGGK